MRTKSVVIFLLFFVGVVGCESEQSIVSILTPAEIPPLSSKQGGQGDHPTLADFWDGTAEFLLDVEDTGLPMGESETIVMETGHYWSYLHASDQSAGAVDQCGDPVTFPGCTVIYYSEFGEQFTTQQPLVCQFECRRCPCDLERDHISKEWAQQQYPDVHYYEPNETLYLVYEFRGETQLRTSKNGHDWSEPSNIGESGHWRLWLRDCPLSERIGEHPFVPYDYECLAGGPPGVFVADDTVYVFMANGESPASMGCFKGGINQRPELYERCDNNPLFEGAQEYGDTALLGTAGHDYWDFRTISSAETIAIGTGTDRRYYMLYEGTRGPSGWEAGGNDQFGVGVARSVTDQIDGAWETFHDNPLFREISFNLGIGHSDLVVDDGITYLYTSLDGVVRSRLELTWKQ